MNSKNTKTPKLDKATKSDGPKKKSVFDHVNHIRQIQDPKYYSNLSDEDKKTFNPFMIIRALSMDSSMVEDMANLYQIYDKIPPAQLYTLLIALVPKSNRFYPWIKSKKYKHNKELLEYVGKRFTVPKYQANEYVNLLLRTEEGRIELSSICRSFGLNDSDIEKLFEEVKYE